MSEFLYSLLLRILATVVEIIRGCVSVGVVHVGAVGIARGQGLLGGGGRGVRAGAVVRLCSRCRGTRML